MKKLLLLSTLLTPLLLASYNNDAYAQKKKTPAAQVSNKRALYCDCAGTIPAPGCTDCTPNCLSDILECHRIAPGELDERAYPAGTKKNKGKIFNVATDATLSDIKNNANCDQKIFICKDFSTRNVITTSNDNILIGVSDKNQPLFDSVMVYYQTQLIKAAITLDATVTALRFYNGKKCDNATYGDILFEAVDANGNVKYCGDLSSDYPPPYIMQFKQQNKIK